MSELKIDDLTFQCTHVKTTKASLLLIQGSQGFLGCGYFDITTADKLEEAVVIVTGVKTCEQMLDKPAVKISKAAKALGITLGMLGRDALKHLA